MQKKLLLTLGLLASINISCAQEKAVNKDNPAKQADKVSLQKVTGLKTPESVVQAKDGKIYVSEINEFGKDGDGQITLIENGKVSVFAKGLDDPKGLAIIGGNLYVADKTKIIKIDAKGQSQVFVEAKAFPAPPLFLNDLEADIAGNLYVSDSGDLFNTGKGGAVYKINAQGQVSLVIKNDQNAKIIAPNGLLMDDTGDVIMVVDFKSGILYSYNMQTKQLTDLAEGFGGGDGLVHHSNGTMYVSDWNNGKVFSINLAGDVKEIKSGYKAAADIAITKDEKYIMVPDMKAGELDFIPIQ